MLFYVRWLEHVAFKFSIYLFIRLCSVCHFSWSHLQVLSKVAEQQLSVYVVWDACSFGLGRRCCQRVLLFRFACTEIGLFMPLTFRLTVNCRLTCIIILDKNLTEFLNFSKLSTNVDSCGFEAQTTVMFNFHRMLALGLRLTVTLYSGLGR